MKRLMMLLMLFTGALMATVPAIMVKKDGSKPSEPLGIKKLDVNVDVAGNLATTTMEITFFNDMDRVLEGQFYFPLVEGAVVSRFALDINGKLQEGVVVEKEKGQKVYESVIRQQIDPGLLQWTKGNNFKARIYPIPAKGAKKLLIAYEQELVKTADGYLYNLPLSFKDKMDLFSVAVTAHNQKVKPVVASKKDLINFSFKESGKNFKATFVQESGIPNKALSFLMPQRTKNVVLVKKGKRDSHFYLNVSPKISKRDKKLPRNLCVVWDGSNSAKTKDIDRELKLINHYISKLNKPMVFLWVLRNDLERIGRLKPGTLTQKVKNIAYDGGTQLGALDLKLKQFSICEEIILSTDGISNFGKSIPNFEEIPIMVLNSKTTAEHSVLNYIARKSGGVYINLAKLKDKAAKLLLTKQPFQFIKAVYNKKTVTETYPSFPTSITKDFALAGRLNGKRGEITLHFGFGTETITTESIKLNLKEHGTDSEMVSRVWATKKIAELDQQPKKYEQELVKLGKKHSIVTRYTSLLVLDRLEDYVQHNIVPPKELQAAYFKIVEHKKTAQKQSERAKLDSLYGRYQNMITYWNKTFKWSKPKPKPRPKKMAVRRSARPRPTARSIARPQRVMMESAKSAKMDDSALGEEKEAEMDCVAPVTKKPVASKKGATGGIQLAKWDPQTPYIKALRKVKKGHYKLYLKLKKGNENSSAFYLDVADFFMNSNRRKIALRVLSNIAEMELENHQLLRILGHRLSQLKYYDLAISIFKQVAQMRKEEPQSLRDLGLTYALNNQPQKAIDHLYKVAIGTWDSRFSDIDLIALHELNGIIALNKKVDTSKLDKRLLKNLHTDIRVVLNWDTDNSDMDLWVTDPNGEKCYYGHKKTYIGGWISRDFTGGYGPEAFWLKRAKPGKYKIEVNYYGSSQQVITGATTLQIQLFLNYGRKNQKLKEITLRLTDRGSKVVQAGSFTIQ